MRLATGHCRSTRARCSTSAITRSRVAVELPAATTPTTSAAVAPVPPAPVALTVAGATLPVGAALPSAAIRTGTDAGPGPTLTVALTGSACVPAGSPATASVTGPAKPALGVTVTCTSRVSPGVSVTTAGAVATVNALAAVGEHIATPSGP